MHIERFCEADYDRIFVMSDIHGYYSLFLKMLEKIELKQGELLIILGDSCDRGPQSIELYQKYMELQESGYCIKHLWGNHEDMLYESVFLYSYYSSLWLQQGGNETIKSYEEWRKKKNIELGKDLDYNISIEKAQWLKKYFLDMKYLMISDKSIFVHAAYDVTQAEEEQDPDYLLWNRNDFWQNNRSGKAIYFGHTPEREGRIGKYANDCYCLDMGTYRTKVLAAMEIKTKREYYVKEETEEDERRE